MPLFSILITAYNVAPWLREALDSVRIQSEPDWECIVVDDASTDGTLEVANEFAASDSRFKILSNMTNVGGGVNIERAAMMASGEISVELGGDDFFASRGALARIASEYSKHKNLDATSGSFVIVPNGGVVDGRPDAMWWRRWSFAKPLTWRTELGQNCLREFKDLQADPATGKFPRYGWDVALYMPIVYRARAYRTIFEVLYAYRLHGANDQTSHRAEQIETEKRIVDYLCPILDPKHLPWFKASA